MAIIYVIAIVLIGVAIFLSAIIFTFTPVRILGDRVSFRKGAIVAACAGLLSGMLTMGYVMTNVFIPLYQVIGNIH
jgi:hypothetical protein